jgi:Ca-activated chloride channel family protein
MGATSVSGRLPPEVIQRIVRQQFGRFRLCYENELRNDPGLEAMVTVRFSILTDGSVGGVAATGSAPATLQRCVANGFRGLAFPQPEGGTVSVNYPIRFSPEGGSSSRSGWRGALAMPLASASVLSGDDKWFDDKPASVAALFDAVQKEPEKRAVRVALVRGLIARGRFEEAKTEAARFVELDPDSAQARELDAQARVAAGDVAGALGALDSMVELSSGSATAHRRAAIAFEVGGDPRRACAHWISAAELSPDVREEAWRCRTRALGERTQVEAEMAAAGLGDVRVKESVARFLDKAWAPTGPAFESLGVTAQCAGSASTCPTFASIDSTGNVVSPLVPDSFARAFPITRAGVYRTVLVGGDAVVPVKLTASVRGKTRSVELRRADRRTAFTTQVAL